MKRTFVLAAAGSLLAAFATAGPAGAAYPGHNGRIAFSSRPVDGGNPEIGVARADGLGITQLTHNGASINDTPSYSPDGTHIAFSSSMSGELQIYVMRADGSDVAQVPTGLPFSYDPTWSPDGSRLAFSGAPADDSPRDLYVVGVDGSGLRQLTDDSADVGVGGISWQPTGGLIAFDSDVTGVMQVYTIAPDGTRRTRLTSGRNDNDQPDFSPDGRTIAYVHGNVRAGGPTSGIDLIDVATRQITPVTDSATRVDTGPAFSPDGRKIAFSTQSQNGSTDIQRINLSSHAIADVVNTVTYDETDPSWQSR